LKSLKEKMLNAPNSPGVYLFKDRSGRVLYVGKAKNLRTRMRQYLSQDSWKPKVLLDKSSDIEFLIVSSEREALLLEDSMIYRHAPPFNVLLTSDLTYSYVILDMSKKFPVIRLTKRRSYKAAASHSRKSFVIGPFVNHGTAKGLYEIARAAFGIRSCRWDEKTPLKRACPLAEIGKCSAPCVGRISREEYMANVKRFQELVSGPIGRLEEFIKEQMLRASNNLQFEKAIVFRNLLREIGNLPSMPGNVGNVSGIYVLPRWFDERGIVVFYFVSDGVIYDTMVWTYRGTDKFEFFERVAADIYIKLPRSIFYTPDEYLYIHLKELGLDVEQLSHKDIEHEASQVAQLILMQQEAVERGYESIADVLGLDGLPLRVEGYDMAHFQGQLPVGGMIVFIGGRPAPREYRVFHLNPTRIADVDMVQETLSRRMRHREWGIPDLIVIDGSEPQLKAALDGIRSSFPEWNGLVVALDKGKERVHLPDGASIKIEEDDPVYRWLRWVMMEAHKHINTFHRKMRDRVGGVLLEVRGIGKKRMERLLDVFGGIYGIYNASLEELITKGGLPKSVAEALYRYLHGLD